MSFSSYPFKIKRATLTACHFLKIFRTLHEVENIENRIENLRKIERSESSLAIETEKLVLDARSDYDERKEIRQKAISLFNANSQYLYEAPGKLIINIGKTGFTFDIEIERAGSQGVENMKVFCYDLTLSQLWADKDIGPGFLVHDSIIFDGVDERQIANALQLAAQESSKHKFQYICMLNSDQVPWDDFDDVFKFQDYVRLSLRDNTEDGGLLGFRF